MKCDWCWKTLSDLPFEFPRECDGCDITTKQVVKKIPEAIVIGMLIKKEKHEK